MNNSPLMNRLNQLPLVLAGPILRHCDLNEVSVWLSTRKPVRITLRVFSVHDESETLAETTAHSVSLGDNLHMTMLHAMTEAPFLNNQEHFAYDLQFDCEGEALSLDEAVDGIERIIYPPYSWPTFQLPAEDLNQVRLIFGSCRKPHGRGQDALPGLDTLLKQTAANHKERPQQLFLIGDQIYADDVADSFLHLLIDAGQTLLGHEEILPGLTETLRPGFRKQAVNRIAQMTSHKSQSHLFSFGEFVAMYLFVWSDVLWPEELPDFDDLFHHDDFKHPLGMKSPLDWFSPEQKLRSKFKHGFKKDRDRLQILTRHIKDVRRAMANIPTYMIFDDHEITDDWYLSRDWCQQVLHSDLGRRILTNGQCAYAFCQAWGNNPAYFEQGPGAELLETTRQWLRHAYDHDREETIENLLGMPRPDGQFHELTRDLSKTCRWDFRVYGPKYEVWVLDTRTWRGFPHDNEEDIPDLISGVGWYQLKEKPHQSSEVTLVVAPTNVVDVPLTERAIKFLARIMPTYLVDRGDSWETQSGAFERLLAHLASVNYQDPRHRRFVFLSGDIHYGFAACIRYWATRPFEGKPLAQEINGVFAHLASSALRNQNGLTLLYHKLGYLPVFPRVATWAGWNQRPHVAIPNLIARIRDMFSKRTEFLEHQPHMLRFSGLPPSTVMEPDPDWFYRFDFLRGERHVSEEVNGLGHRRYGADIVGVNNLGELMFDWQEGKEAVVQRLWWRIREESHIEPLSQYRISLVLDEEENFPKPKLPHKKLQEKP